MDRIDFLKFKREDIDKINRMIEIDTKLMCDFKLMDYSLLFAIEKIPRAQRRQVSMKYTLTGNPDTFVDNSTSVLTSDNRVKHI